MPSEFEKINDQLNLLMEIVSKQDPANTDKWREQIDKIKGQYRAAEGIANTGQTDADKKYAKDVCDAISKNLPNFIKGVEAAVSAFNKGDDVRGSAAIFDIFASATPILNAIFAASGPEGVLIGSIFSMIGQILAFWAPKQEQLTSQIKKILLDIEAEEKIQEEHAVTTAVQLYATALRSVEKDIPITLEKGKHLLTKADANKWETALRTMNNVLTEARTTFLNSNMTQWTVQEWLNTKTRQDLDKWPEVFAAYCHMNADLRSAQMTCQCSLDPQVVIALYAVLEDDSSPVDKDERSTLKHLLSEFISELEAIRELDGQRTTMVDENLEKCRQPTQSWGFFTSIGGKGYLYACAGPKAIKTGDWTYLGSDSDAITSGSYYIDRKCLVPYPEDASAVHPRYHCFLQRANATRKRTVVAKTPPESYDDHALFDVNGQSNGWNLGTTGWAMWAMSVDPARGGLRVFHAIDQTIMHHWTNGRDDEWANDGTRNWSFQDATSRVTSIRATYPASLPDDPEGELDSVFGPDSTQFARGVVYGALENSQRIYVIKGLTPDYGYVPTPWNQDLTLGIGVDRHYLWVVSPWGIACATHISILKYFNEQEKGNVSGAFRWNYYDLNKNYRAPAGLARITACDDRTVTIEGTVSYENGWVPTGDYRAYTAAFNVDAKANIIHFPDGWTRLEGGMSHIEKQPSYCWPLLEAFK